MNQPDCAHHYVLSSPNGTTSLGVCRDCGVEKVFYNWMEDEARPHRNYDRKNNAPPVMATRVAGRYGME